jgi:hypothetical protein
MHRTFTSGVARRNELATEHTPGDPLIFWDNDAGYEIRGTSPENQAMITRVNARHEQAGLINPILDRARDDLYQGDPDLGSHISEWLFQLARIWSEWQSPRIGTFPLEYQDHFGPVTREQSIETGEDYAYWSIDDALAEMAGIVDIGADRWDQPEVSTQLVMGYSDLIQDAIVHATAVLSRLSHFHPLD